MHNTAFLLRRIVEYVYVDGVRDSYDTRIGI